VANGVILRTLVNDVIDIFEVNRKECDKILLELPRWVGRGTFKTKASSSRPKMKRMAITLRSP
jgi:nuclear cap-binding protein subunit 1